jgi:transcription initiation factor TFIIB
MIVKKSKKNKILKSNHDKAKLWNMFDSNIIKKKPDFLECIYDTIENKDICEKCNSSLVFTDEGFLLCTNTSCNIIYKDVVNMSVDAESRHYNSNESKSGDPTRYGMPINIHLPNSSFGCKLNYNKHSSYETKNIGKRINWHTSYYNEKTIYEDTETIRMMGLRSNIPLIILNDAVQIHYKISKKDFTYRGIKRASILAASLFLSFEKNNCPRTSKEIAIIANISNEDASQGCKTAISILNEIEYNNNDNNDNIVHNIYKKATPSSFIERYCSKLYINNELTKVCKFVSLKIEKYNLLPENNADSIASGIIFYISQICNLNISKKTINSISNISEVTINKCYKKLEAISDTLIPQKILQKYS